MADTVHLFEPGSNVTVKASGVIVGGTLVKVAGDFTVATATANATEWLGVAATDAADGADVLVLRGGIVNIEASGAVTAGAQLVAAASGKVAALAAASAATAGDINNARAVVGIALTGGTGVVISVALAR